MTAPTASQLDIFSAVSSRDQALKAVEQNADKIDKQVIRQAIRTVAARGVPFSANDVRPLLPTLVSNNVIGPIFGALARAGEIRKYGYVPSTSETTNGHDIKLWIAIPERYPYCATCEMEHAPPLHYDEAVL